MLGFGAIAEAPVGAEAIATVRRQVSADLALAWTIAHPVSVDLPLVWTVAQPVSADLPLAWSIDADAFTLLQIRLVRAFLAEPPVAGGNVLSNRDDPLALAETEGLRVYMTSADMQEPELLGAPADWTTTWRVDCLARSANANPRPNPLAADPTTAAGPLLRAAWARAATLRADDLGAIAVRISRALRWSADASDTLVCAATFFVEIDHRTDPITLQPAA